MQKRIFGPITILLLSLPLFGCSSSRPPEPVLQAPSDRWHITLEIDAPVQNRGTLVNETVEVLKNRLNQFGVSGSNVEIDGTPEAGRIRVNLPRVNNPERVKNFIASQGMLQLVRIISEPNPAPAKLYETKDQAEAALQESGNSSARVLRCAPSVAAAKGLAKSVRWINAELPPLIDGKDIQDAKAIPVHGENAYDISFTLTPRAVSKYGAWRSANPNQYVGVVLNNEVKSIVFTRSKTVDTGTIEVNFTQPAAEDLAHMLKAGALPAPVKVVELRDN